MLYNKDLKKTVLITDCIACPYWDKKLKKCEGIGTVCFEYDEKTRTAIDAITKLPIQLD